MPRNKLPIHRSGDVSALLREIAQAGVPSLQAELDRAGRETHIMGHEIAHLNSRQQFRWDESQISAFKTFISTNPDFLSFEQNLTDDNNGIKRKLTEKILENFTELPTLYEHLGIDGYDDYTNDAGTPVYEIIEPKVRRKLLAVYNEMLVPARKQLQSDGVTETVLSSSERKGGLKGKAKKFNYTPDVESEGDDGTPTPTPRIASSSSPSGSSRYSPRRRSGASPFFTAAESDTQTEQPRTTAAERKITDAQQQQQQEDPIRIAVEGIARLKLLGSKKERADERLARAEDELGQLIVEGLSTLAGGKR